MALIPLYNARLCFLLGLAESALDEPSARCFVRQLEGQDSSCGATFSPSTIEAPSLGASVTSATVIYSDQGLVSVYSDDRK